MTRHRWALAALAAVACAIGGVVAPSSWWGVGLALAYGATMALAYATAPERSRDAWRWVALLTTFGVTMLAGTYAFLVEPFGPDPVVALVLAVLLALAVAVAVMS